MLYDIIVFSHNPKHKWVSLKILHKHTNILHSDNYPNFLAFLRLIVSGFVEIFQSQSVLVCNCYCQLIFGFCDVRAEIGEFNAENSGHRAKSGNFVLWYFKNT